MKKMLMTFVFSLVSLAAGIATASSEGLPSLTADEALQKLIDGNKRYVENNPTNSSRSDAHSRSALAHSQKPYAIILTCSDSRVPPELIFDMGDWERYL